MSNNSELNLTLARLNRERKAWRQNHPWGYVACPTKHSDGFTDMFCWRCVVPGKPGTPWQNGHYELLMYFSLKYPQSPPFCKFCPPIYHPNVDIQYGYLELDILMNEAWRPSYTVKDILIAINETLAVHNPRYIMNNDAAEEFRTDPLSYKNRIRWQSIRSMRLSGLFD
ncbi:SUMO-conjugating enzyme UBC9-B-like [Anopheles stephensi]|uniref:UBC core domain-containing protein n=1 Tax=Anopheles stephensi TaxID=30069 RepID=A0A182Y7R3_ANOST|nr:SUMO-conjugating enzyme UBC9-B-like [Anopheles stephensi]XP_035907141.1 SUMO-conjugating enzyme UBC9-B-like [Anopheles stephensi]